MALDAAMAVATGLTQLSTLAAHTADNIADKWYEASKDLEDFQELEKKLKRRIDIWKEALRNEGMSDDIRLREPLADAIKCLEKEKIKMDTVQSNCCLFRFLYMFKSEPFPPLLQDSMKRVLDAFDNIHNAYHESSEPARILEELANDHLDPYQITVDRRIIKLADTQDKVMQHLNERTGIQVVTLYGGTGSGKTSLAKLVAQYYLDNRTVFADGARFLSCGNNKSVDSICKDLFQSLGISEANIDSAPEQATKSKGEGQPSGVSTPRPTLVKKLARRLKERHLLIVLDDVSDPDMLKEKLIVLNARGVKYLITSQNRNIYDGAILIHMEPPTMDEAMKILGNYIPNSPNGEIPSNLQDKAMEIIQEAEFLPLTLATVGRQIHDYDDEPSWDVVLHGFNDLFSSREHPYRDKLALSMLMAVEALDDNSEARTLLYLLAMCESLVLVPRTVLQLLFRRVDSKHLSTFEKHEKNLKDRDLISVVDGKYWTLNKSYQLVILKNKKEEVSELLCTLMKEDIDDEDNELVKALCVMYIFFEKDTYTPAATSAIKEAANTFNISLEDQTMKFSLRGAIYRLMHLLCISKDAKNGNEFEPRRHRLASKVIKEFISKQELDDDSFVQLLGEKDIYEDICAVLVDMTIFTNDQKQKPILTKEVHQTLDELIFNLTPTSEEIVTTVDTLSEVSHEANCDLILDTDDVLINLLEILHSIHQDEKQSVPLTYSTLSCFSALAQSSTAREKIASCDGLIEKLIAIFDMDSDITEMDHVMVKFHAAKALGAIGLQEKTSTLLVKTPNLLSSIAQFLEDIYFKDQDRKLFLEIGHYNATYTTIDCLLSLSKGNDSSKGEICKHEHLMHVLTQIFETYNNQKYYNNNNPKDYITGDEYVVVPIVELLTLIDPTEYNKVRLHSKEAYIARGDANIFCGLYKQAFDDYRRADRIDNSNDWFYKTKLCFLKVMLKDYKGALHYARWATEEQPNKFYVWQESGVLKELMGDYEGAKNDLNKALAFLPKDYEILKHRAYVNFKLGCEKEAHEDAQEALQVIPIIDKPDSGQRGYLGAFSVPQFLDYEFK